MNAEADTTVRTGSPLPPPTPRPQGPHEPPASGHPGVWSLVGLLAGVAGIVLVWFPGGGHGRPDLSGPSLVEVLAVFGGAGLGVAAVALSIILLATIEPDGWPLALTIAAIPIGVIACLMASVVAFSG